MSDKHHRARKWSKKTIFEMKRKHTHRYNRSEKRSFLQAGQECTGQEKYQRCGPPISSKAVNSLFHVAYSREKIALEIVVGTPYTSGEKRFSESFSETLFDWVF